jgi:hypothetical protein
MKAGRVGVSVSALLWGATVLVTLCGEAEAYAPHADYVIHISVDGLRPDAITALGPGEAANFYRMRSEGAFTDNARSDYDSTSTLPNHVTQLTGRGVAGTDGHNWTGNSTPPEDVTLHTNKGSYVHGAFDVAHDYGLSTGLYAGKDKFILFDQSWGDTSGAPDTVLPDDGQDKIDTYVYNSDTSSLFAGFLSSMSGPTPHNYCLLHLRDTDAMGHAYGWDPTVGSEYSDTVLQMDNYLGQVFDLIESDADLTGRTAIVLTADHGGSGTSHTTPSVGENYTIPFYVWGPGVAPGADLYLLNSLVRSDPGTGRPTYSDPDQPIRNGGASNLALDFLGLGAIPFSTINSSQDLTVPAPGALPPLMLAFPLLLRRRKK